MPLLPNETPRASASSSTRGEATLLFLSGSLSLSFSFFLPSRSLPLPLLHSFFFSSPSSSRISLPMLPLADKCRFIICRCSVARRVSFSLVYDFSPLVVISAKSERSGEKKRPTNCVACGIIDEIYVFA